jgi:hypothetical protein
MLIKIHMYAKDPTQYIVLISRKSYHFIPTSEAAMTQFLPANCQLTAIRGACCNLIYNKFLFAANWIVEFDRDWRGCAVISCKPPIKPYPVNLRVRHPANRHVRVILGLRFMFFTWKNYRFQRQTAASLLELGTFELDDVL